MRKIIALAAAAVTAASAVSFAVPADAREWRRPGINQNHYNGRHYSGYRGHRGGYYGYGYGYDRGSNGAVAAGVLGGLAVGALIGSAANAQANAGSPEAYCASRFRSYDPASGTYLAYDGNRYACP